MSAIIATTSQTIIYPPVSLQSLFTDLDFLSGIKDNQKINVIKKTYVDKDSWPGSFWRLWDGEKQSITGNFMITQIVKNSVEMFQVYKNVAPYGEQLIQKIVLVSHAIPINRAYYEIIKKNSMLISTDFLYDFLYDFLNDFLKGLECFLNDL